MLFGQSRILKLCGSVPAWETPHREITADYSRNLAVAKAVGQGKNIGAGPRDADRLRECVHVPDDLT